MPYEMTFCHNTQPGLGCKSVMLCLWRESASEFQKAPETWETKWRTEPEWSKIFTVSQSMTSGLFTGHCSLALGLNSDNVVGKLPFLCGTVDLCETKVLFVDSRPKSDQNQKPCRFDLFEVRCVIWDFHSAALQWQRQRESVRALEA